MVLGSLEEMVNATKQTQAAFSSIDEVLRANNKPTRKRGRRT